MVVSKRVEVCVVWLAFSACLSGLHIGSGAIVVWCDCGRGPCLSAGLLAEVHLLALQCVVRGGQVMQHLVNEVAMCGPGLLSGVISWPEGA